MFNLTQDVQDSRFRLYYIAKNFLGIDQAVGYALLFRSWGLISVPITFWFVTTKFSAEVQGYYYTFTTLLLFQTLLELGFGVVMVQFISHEWAHLRWKSHNELEGDHRSLMRLASLVRLGIKWYLMLALLFFVIVGTIGYFFLSQYKTNIDFQIPWWLLCFSVSLSILILPMRNLLEGTNQIARNQMILLKANIASTIAGWLAIYSGAQLYSLAIISGISVVAGFLLLVPTFLPFLKIEKTRQIDNQISWRHEFWPQQWRIGTSWLSGFFMFQSFVPIMFQLHGPVVAGQMGATMQVYQSVNSFALSWTNVVGPKMGVLAARRDYSALRSLVNSTYKRSLAASIVFSIAAFSVILLLHHYGIPQVSRFADLPSISILLLVCIVIQPANVATLAVRFQKEEPFVVNSIVSALLVIASSLTLGRYYGIMGSVVGFASIMVFITIPWVYKLYTREMRP